MTANAPLVTPERIIKILDVARFAPSVHNTQPWRVKAEGDFLRVTLDPRHTLTDGDPTRRQTYISLGIFTEAIGIGASLVGLKITDVKHKEAEVLIYFSEGKAEVPSTSAELLRRRCSDRSIYKPANLSQKFVQAVTRTGSGINVQLITNPAFQKTVADLTAKGIRMALSNPGFRRELSQYLVVPWSAKRRGIAVKSLYIPYPLAILQPWFIRFGLNHKAEASLEKKRWESASGIIVITGDGDMPQYWLAAGRTYLQISLEIEKAGLSQATSAAIVEASNFHEDIEELLHTRQRVLAILRVGAGSAQKQFSPRLEAQDIITSS